MSNHFFYLLFISFLSCMVFSTSSRTLSYDESSTSTQTYIIQVQTPPTFYTKQSWHLTFFPQSRSYPPSILYSYETAISGFAAQLTDTELEDIKAKPGFLSYIPDFLVPLATTHTPEFLGLSTNSPGGFWNASGLGRGVIVALLDTGVLPNHPSFDDHDMPPPPEKWKGKCEFNASSCNNKLVGARTFLQGAKAMMGEAIPDGGSPLDTIGHGTHTASTAVGAFVMNASALGNAGGTAAGIAPSAHLAVYKICTDFGCTASDILAGLDAAVEEGADVLSLSLGGPSRAFYIDPIAIGTLAAVEKGLFVSLAAGNNGPNLNSLSNEAPWMLTVGASTMDRLIGVTVKLGNGDEYEGESLYQTNSIASDLLPLVYPGGSGSMSAKFCYNNSLNNDVKGKIVVCDRGGGMGRISQGAVVKSAGGAGMILAAGQSDGYTTMADAHVLPASHVSYLAASKIKSYIKSTSSPTTTIIPRGTIIGATPAPTIAAFSSRGPALQSKGILKPDIIGPGVNVLAGWPALPIGPFDSPAFFNVISGTSMSTPHLSGIAALLKSMHPTWSPAAIRSAILTTAENENRAGDAVQDEELKTADVFARGAGHVNPTKANNPGFVYDIHPADYIGYLCGLNYTDAQVTAVARRTVNCSTLESIFDVDLNYPSFSVEMRPAFSRKVRRKVKNVGEAGSSSSYKVEIVAPAGIAVAVFPAVLRFTESAQELSYTVEFSRDGRNSSVNYAEGYIRWVSSDKLISVRSPISITFTDK